MEIRKAMISDIPFLGKLILSCIANDYKKYSKRKLDAMRKYSSEDNLEKYLKTRGWVTFVCIEKNEMRGVISMQDNSVIFSLYAKNNKIKRSLIKFVEKRALRHRAKKVISISMPETKEDYLKRNFDVSEKIVLAFGDVKFNEFKLEKRL